MSLFLLPAPIPTVQSLRFALVPVSKEEELKAECPRYPTSSCVGAPALV